jgi:putative restriction endonuclease
MLSCLPESTKDDVDRGVEVIYTGQGGRDEAMGRQVADQELTRGNVGLVISWNEGLLLRIIRKIEGGYSYDGPCIVTDAWHEKGKSGHRNWRYRLVALEPEILLRIAIRAGQPLLEVPQEQTSRKKTCCLKHRAPHGEVA